MLQTVELCNATFVRVLYQYEEFACLRFFTTLPTAAPNVAQHSSSH